MWSREEKKMHEKLQSSRNNITMQIRKQRITVKSEWEQKEKAAKNPHFRLQIHTKSN